MVSARNEARERAEIAERAAYEAAERARAGGRNFRADEVWAEYYRARARYERAAADAAERTPERPDADGGRR